MPETCRLDVGGGVHLAVQRWGSGPTALVWVPGMFSHVELQWADAAYARFLASLGRFAVVTTYDKRGVGASDPVDRAPTLEEHLHDLSCVVEDTGAERIVLLGFSDGSAVAMAYAAAHPERLVGLVLCSAFARVEGCEEAIRRAEELSSRAFDRWGEGVGLELSCPSLAGSKLARRNFAVFERAALHPEMLRGMVQESARWDVTPMLGEIDAPTLVLHRRDEYVPFESGREVARRIRGARFVELEGGDHVPYLGDTTRLLTELETFVRAVADDPAPARPVTTVLFTDLVGSTDRAVAAGDARWRALREAHDDLTIAEVRRVGGRPVKSTGDGWLAVFDDAPSAVRAASAVVEQVRRLELEVRAGAHTGPIDVLDDGDVAGVVVNTAARVAALAEAGEVLVTDAVRGRLAAAIPVRPWGVAELKGLPGAWTLHRVDGEVDEHVPTQPASDLAPEVRGATRVALAAARLVLGPVYARLNGVR